MTNNIPNLKKRYLFKVTRSVIVAGLSMVSLPVVTRSLGAEHYGIFNYLKTIFQSIIGFFDVFTSAFYPKISKRPGDGGIIKFVALYDSVLFLLTFIMLFLLFISGKVESVLTIQSVTITYSVLLFVWLMLISDKISKYLDALGETIVNEIILLIRRLILTFGLVLLFYTHKLNLMTYLHIQNITLIVFLVVFLGFAAKYYNKDEKISSVKEIAKEFKSFSMPLFWAGVVGIFINLADRWLLQIFGGSTAQGYYSFGINLSVIAFLLTSSATPLLYREYSIAHENNDKDRLKYLFSKFPPFFYVITATIACYLVMHGDWLAPIIGGGDFKDSALPVMLLGLAPLHQTYGQMSGSLMTATDRTREYGGISMFIDIVGLPVTYLLLAPEQYGGLNLGATGLAIKLVTLQILAVNIQIWYSTRYLGIGMSKFITHQVLVALLFLFFAYIGKSIVGLFLGFGIVALLSSGVLYLSLVFTIIFIFPSLVIMTRSELLNHIKTPAAFFKS